ncbi:type 1 glutamine amidotransferase [Roseovarius aquimarinus]|uniref:Type 1 glutamine amidotransferase n=1 Tax=Roseovarius aquimarinus TaxID=1229156 RepID=A0ABW7I7V8_9RHOB
MRVLILQHTKGEHPAAFADHVAAAGDAAHVVHLYLGEGLPDLAPFHAMMVMGGPMDVWEEDAHPWLVPEKRAIAAWVRSGRPYLGICLGHQLLVEAMGGQCAKMAVPEVGVMPMDLTEDGRADPVLSRLPGATDGPVRVMQWHGVEAVRLPADTAPLARNANCPVQAIRVGRRAWGVQFHPEITEDLCAYWMKDPGNRATAIDWLGSAEAADRFAADSEAHVPTALRNSAALYAGLREAALEG